MQQDEETTSLNLELPDDVSLVSRKHLIEFFSFVTYHYGEEWDGTEIFYEKLYVTFTYLCNIYDLQQVGRSDIFEYVLLVAKTHPIIMPLLTCTFWLQFFDEVLSMIHVIN